MFFFLLQVDRSYLSFWAITNMRLLYFLLELLLSFETIIEINWVEEIKLGLVLHELDLKVLVSLIMISNQVIDTLEQSSQSSTIVLFLQQELSFGEHLNQVH